MSPSSLIPGPEGTPVPGGVSVLRLANEPSIPRMSPEAVRRVMGEKKALPEFFELSTEDKKQAIPRLSVWVESITTVEQAWVLVGEARHRRIVMTLEADRIRSLWPHPPEPVHPGLDVEWEPATRLDGAGGRVPETRPGAEGHAGITRFADAHGTKSQRKSLRFQIAEIAVVRILDDAEIDQIIAQLPPTT